MRFASLVCLPLILFAALPAAWAQTPEIQREAYPAQAPGKVHTIRIIPEV